MIYFSVSPGILEILNSYCLLKSEKYCRKIFVEQLAFGCILRDTHSPTLSSPIRGSYFFALIKLHILWYSFTILSVWLLPWERLLAISSFPNNLFTSGLAPSNPFSKPQPVWSSQANSEHRYSLWTFCWYTVIFRKKTHYSVFLNRPYMILLPVGGSALWEWRSWSLDSPAKESRGEHLNYYSNKDSQRESSKHKAVYKSEKCPLRVGEQAGSGRWGKALTLCFDWISLHLSGLGRSWDLPWGGR